MDINDFLKLAHAGIESATNGKEHDYNYELECILQYLIPDLSKHSIQLAIEKYKANYTRQN